MNYITKNLSEKLTNFIHKLHEIFGNICSYMKNFILGISHKNKIGKINFKEEGDKILEKMREENAIKIKFDTKNIAGLNEIIKKDSEFKINLPEIKPYEFEKLSKLHKPDNVILNDIIREDRNLFKNKEFYNMNNNNFREASNNNFRSTYCLYNDYETNYDNLSFTDPFRKKGAWEIKKRKEYLNKEAGIFKDIFNFSITSLNNVNLFMPKEIIMHIISYIDPDKLIAPKTLEKLVHSSYIENFKDWTEKSEGKKGFMSKNLLSNKKQKEYREIKMNDRR